MERHLKITIYTDDKDKTLCSKYCDYFNKESNKVAECFLFSEQLNKKKSMFERCEECILTEIQKD